MTQPPEQPARLARGLGFWEAMAIVVGTCIGSGIFFKPNVVAASLGRLDLVVALWIAGGLVSLCGALTYAELAAMLPEAGGPYVYLRETFGRFWAFLLGWTDFWIMRTGAVAALAVVSAASLGRLVPIPPNLERGVAVALIVLLAVVNASGTRRAGRLQDVMTLAKAVGLAALSLLPFLWAGGGVRNWDTVGPVAGSLAAGMASAMLAIMWAYDGWTNVTTVAEEVRDPQRILPGALLVGVAAVTGLYVLVTLAVHYALPMAAIAASRYPAADVATAVLGPVGGTILVVLVLISTVGTLNADLLCSPRVFFAMARDGVFFHALAKVHPTRHTPTPAIAATAAWSAVLVVVADTLSPGKPLFDVLTDYAIFGGLGFSVLAAASVMVLRRTRPEAVRPYRTWGYPIVPLIFMAATTGLLVAVLVAQPAQSLAGLGLIALGAPAYWLWTRSRPGYPINRA